MSDRSAFGRILGILGVSASTALSVAGCAPYAGDINTVQPGYVKKAIFQTGDEWYYRRTVVDSETTNSFAIEGSGDIFLDRVKFRVEEGYLIAYKPYEAIPGSQDEEHDFKGDFQGPVLAAWPITSHFDIIRGYDPATGNKTNIISENTTDRPWYQRDFIRVDFSTNVVEKNLFAGWGVYELVYYPFEDDWGTLEDGTTGRRWTSLDSSPTDPFASRFTNDYVEITNQAIIGMDLWNCATMVGFQYDAFTHCGYGEAKIRSSFARIKEPSDFVPRDYPDSVVRKDADGRVQYDPETGEAVREPIFERFGFYRVETPTYDRGYGTTESGRLFRAFLFNLWERHTDAQGNPLAYSQRKPKPIIYYLNAEYPARWRTVAAEAATEYNRVMSSMVADLMGKSVNEIPAMFEIRDNDCNIDNVKKFVSQNADLEFAVARAVCTTGTACDSPMNKIAFGNLEKVCTSLEAATRDPETGLSQFEWQRIGDARHKMIVWLSNPQMSGWGGYGPMHADARTGESVSATSFMRGFSYEVGASRVVDYIELMNGTASVEDIIYGQDIRRQVQQTLQRAKVATSATAGRGLLSRIKQRTQELGRNKTERLVITDDPNHQINRMKRMEGTGVEAALITDLDLALAAHGKWQPGEPVTEQMMRQASPLGRLTEMDTFAPVRDRARRALGQAGFCFLDVDLDPHFAGLALALKDLPREEMYRRVAHRLIKHVLLHELGHNFGLEHNFEGSYDALNYWDEFWQLNWAEPADQVRGGYDEHRNTTVMEYQSTKGLFSDRLGKYDEAAIRFGYGQQVQVFNRSTVEGGQSLKAWRYLHDYQSIPNYLCGGTCGSPDEARSYINDRSWVAFKPEAPPPNEVPYGFCNDAYSRRTPFCATFDYGSNLREIHQNYYTMWSGYFFFNNFIRDRLVPVAWDPWNAMQSTVIPMRNINVVNQYLQYFQALDPNFVEETELGNDMAITVAQGLNMVAEVLGTPEPLRMCPIDDTNPPIYFPYWRFNATYCDEYEPLDSPHAKTIGAIQLPLGPARPSTIGFTDDFVDYDISFVGSYFDKLFALERLGYYGNTLFRFNYELDLRSYQMSLYRLFEPEIRSLLDRLISYDAYIWDTETYEALGSYWCRNTDFPDDAALGSLIPRMMIDPDSGETWPERPPANCQNVSRVYPSLLRNMPFLAMVYSHIFFSSDFDAQLDMGKSMRIYVLGADDEPVSWRNLPPNMICEVTDDLTGFRYRAVHQPAGFADVGCRIIDRARVAQLQYQGTPQDDFLRERWRQWMERLEYARDLTKLYNP